jgi:hypothetical protein
VALVYGAFEDGPGWQPVYELLTKKAKNLHLKILQKQGVVVAGRQNKVP